MHLHFQNPGKVDVACSLKQCCDSRAEDDSRLVGETTGIEPHQEEHLEPQAWSAAER